MEKQNITLSLPKDVLLRIKIIAVQRQTSVSGLLTQTLERIVQLDDAYINAQRRHQQWLEQGADLGTDGQPPAERDALHDRS
jgi:hypothetical protein